VKKWNLVNQVPHFVTVIEKSIVITSPEALPEANVLLIIICSAATYLKKSVEYASEVYKNKQGHK
jgi:hypothetical protein